MSNKNNNGANEKREEKLRRSIDGRYSPETASAGIPGINTPGIELPAFNPPVPNRAWTAMCRGIDIDELSEEEREELYDPRELD